MLELFRGQRPLWSSEAACHGMGKDFHDLDHEGQQRVCDACPVTIECLDDLWARNEQFGLREMNDGDTVCGGLTPAQQRSAWNERNKAKK